MGVGIPNPAEVTQAEFQTSLATATANATFGQNPVTAFFEQGLANQIASIAPQLTVESILEQVSALRSNLLGETPTATESTLVDQVIAETMTRWYLSIMWIGVMMPKARDLVMEVGGEEFLSAWVKIQDLTAGRFNQTIRLLGDIREKQAKRIGPEGIAQPGLAGDVELAAAQAKLEERRQPPDAKLDQTGSEFPDQTQEPADPTKDREQDFKDRRQTEERSRQDLRVTGRERAFPPPESASPGAE